MFPTNMLCTRIYILDSPTTDKLSVISPRHGHTVKGPMKCKCMLTCVDL